jgi:hypothetical protein
MEQADQRLGLIGMQINMPDSGTFLFISDHCHVIENVSCDCCETLREGQKANWSFVVA